MNIYCFSILIFAIASFSIGFEIFIRRKDRIGNLYFILSILFAWWGIFAGLSVSGIFDYNTSLFFARFLNLGAAFIPICWLHFTCVYTGKNPRNVLWLYLIPAFIGVFFNTPYFVSGLRETMHFKYCSIAGPLFYLHAATFITIVPISFWILFADAHKDKTPERRNKFIFAWVSSVGYAGGIPTFLPCFGIDFPQYLLVLMPLYPFGMTYFMSSQGLFNVENIAAAAHKDKLAALGILTASINHEIRSPLFMMRGTIETETNSGVKVKLLNQIDRITGIVSRLTHFAKKGVDEVAKIEPVDLQEILTDIRPLFQHQINYQHIEYSQEIPTNLPRVLADRRYLEEILFNLILNACQAVRETKNPIIKLSATSLPPMSLEGKRRQGPKLSDQSVSRQSLVVSPASITIVIEDNGPGIPPDQVKHIFKPFHTTKSEGTGLGLYITKQLVEKCGGKIEVQSKVGEGAKFIVSFKGE